MEEEIDSRGFYRDDFSSESEWEVLISKLGEFFQKLDSKSEWCPDSCDDILNCKWKTQTAELTFEGKEMNVTLYEAVPSGEKISSPAPLKPFHNIFKVPPSCVFDTDLHPLTYHYGLQQFVVLKPKVPFYDFSTFNIFLSAMTVAAADSSCSVPMFLQTFDFNQNTFIGVAMPPNLKTNFNLVLLQRAPEEYRHLQGILSLFKGKLRAGYTQSARVSVRTTYALEALRPHIPMHIPFAMKFRGGLDSSALDTSDFYALPSGYFLDSYSKTFIDYSWPEISESAVVDSALHEGFLPHDAPFSSMYQVIEATSYLSRSLRDYQSLQHCNQSLDSHLGNGTFYKNYVAFKRTREETLVSIEGGDCKKTSFEPPSEKIPGPLNENELYQMSCYLFPDINPDMVLFPYRENYSEDSSEIMLYADSLLDRLSCLIVLCNAHFGGIQSVVQLWFTFIRNLYSFWNNSSNIQGVRPTESNVERSLLQKKLEIFNTCIQSSDGQKLKMYNEHDLSDENDEFHDCLSGETENADLSNERSDNERSVAQKDTLHGELPDTSSKSSSKIHHSDDAREAMKILDYFETLTINEVYKLTAPHALRSAIFMLRDIFRNYKIFDIFHEQFDEALTKLRLISGNMDFSYQSEIIEDIFERIEALEKYFYQFICLRGSMASSELEEIRSVLKEIVKTGSVNNFAKEETDSSQRVKPCDINKLFSSNFTSSMSLVSKDYVIRSNDDINVNIRSGPQFLRAIVTGEQVRLCAAFTENTAIL